MATVGAGHSDRGEAPDWVLREVEYLELTYYHKYFKRPFDLICSALLLVLVSPLVILIAALVRLQVGSPVIYTQERVGRHGRPFTIYKFRTMIPDRRTVSRDFPGPERRRVHKTVNDPRVVPLGRALRKYSLDELPQLLNVIRGEMSLVGPRPEMPEIVAEYQDWQHARHSVRPGLTGLWQISARHKLLKDSTDLDIEYIESISFAVDLKILMATPLAALGYRRGF